MEKSEFTSVLDKTDWRDTIKKALSECAENIGAPNQFISSVKYAIKAVGAEYPGWDAFAEVNKEVMRISNEWEDKKVTFFLDNPKYWFKRYLRRRTLLKVEYNKSEEIFDFLRNLTGRHRMLLYGMKRVESGDQMDLPGVKE